MLDFILRCIIIPSILTFAFVKVLPELGKDYVRMVKECMAESPARSTKKSAARIPSKRTEKNGAVYVVYRSLHEKSNYSLLPR